MKFNQFTVLQILLLLLLSIPVLSLSQSPDDKTILMDEFKHYFVGTWQGSEKGTTGDGVGTRSYESVLQEQFVLMKNQSVFAPDQKNKNREIHQDWGMFSMDKKTNTLIYRQFVSEGFVNMYEVNRIRNVGSSRWLFETRCIENLSSGWRAKITITVITQNKFEEKFELAQPGQDYRIMLNNTWIKTSN